MVPVTGVREVEQGIGEEFLFAVQPFPLLLLSLLVALTAPTVQRMGIFNLIQGAGREGASAVVLSTSSASRVSVPHERESREPVDSWAEVV